MMATGKRNIVLALFGLPFAGAGLAVLWFFVISSLLEWKDIQQWEPTPAKILSAQLVESRSSKGSIMYRAEARYRYSYGGNDYISDRVAIQGGSDNIGSFQQDLAQALESAANNEEPYIVYVNPRAPDEAVANRELRSGQMALLAVFGGIFSAVGLGLIVFGLLRRGDGDTGFSDSNAPWLSRSEWSSPEIRSKAGAGAIFAWVFAGFWCVISGVATVFAVDEFLTKGNQAALFVLLFDAVGILLLAWAIHATISARRFGELVLQLDPHPGSIGGDVGGMIDVPIDHDPARAITVSLTCLHVYVRGSGKNRETRRDPVWSDTRYFLGEISPQSQTRVNFRFAVPDGLPVSSAPGSDYHEWVLRVECALPGVDLSREFSIPVFATAQKMRLASRVRESQAESLAHLESLMNLEQTPGGISLDFRAGRNIGSAVAVFIFGVIFTAVPVLMWLYGNDIPALIKVIFLGIFGLIGVGCMAGGFWMLGNRLQVFFDSAGVRIKRTLFGIPVSERVVARESIAGLVAARGGSMTVGSKVTVFYGLALKLTDGSTKDIGDGLRGYGEAERAAGVIASYTRFAFLGEHDRRAAFKARKQARQSSNDLRGK